MWGERLCLAGAFTVYAALEAALWRERVRYVRYGRPYGRWYDMYESDEPTLPLRAFDAATLLMAVLLWSAVALRASRMGCGGFGDLLLGGLVSQGLACQLIIPIIAMSEPTLPYTEQRWWLSRLAYTCHLMSTPLWMNVLPLVFCVVSFRADPSI